MHTFPVINSKDYCVPIPLPQRASMLEWLQTQFIALHNGLQAPRGKQMYKFFELKIWQIENEIQMVTMFCFLEQRKFTFHNPLERSV